MPTTVVLLHSMGASGRIWRAQIEALGATTTSSPLTCRATVIIQAGVVRPADDRDRAALEADIRPPGRRTQLDGLRELVRNDLRPRLATITAPTLVCCGERDRPNLSSARLLAAEIPNARLEIIPGGGHLWSLQRPELCTEFIREIVGGHEGRNL